MPNVCLGENTQIGKEKKIKKSTCRNQVLLQQVDTCDSLSSQRSWNRLRLPVRGYIGAEQE